MSVAPWILTRVGVPIVADFLGTSGQGTPLVINTTTGLAYYLAPGGVVTEVSGGALALKAPRADPVFTGIVSTPGVDIPAGALGNYVNDAAAAAGGVPIKTMYRNGSVLMIRVV